ncbi:hypothetical protein [Saccharothrix texasensis]|nr:hypothetical protein [Saccharothrix texasensis]
MTDPSWAERARLSGLVMRPESQGPDRPKPAPADDTEDDQGDTPTT